MLKKKDNNVVCTLIMIIMKNFNRRSSHDDHDSKHRKLAHHAHSRGSHAFTHTLHQHSYNHIVRSANSAITEFGIDYWVRLWSKAMVWCLSGLPDPKHIWKFCCLGIMSQCWNFWIIVVWINEVLTALQSIMAMVLFVSFLGVCNC